MACGAGFAGPGGRGERGHRGRLPAGRPARRALLAAAAVPIAAGLNDGLLKHLVHRTYLGALSYPSGHIATMSALAATVAVLLLAPPQTVRTGPLRMLLSGAACVAGGVVAIGVIGLRWHYFTDTVAGAAVGLGVVCGLALLLDLQAVRQLLSPGVRPAADGSGPSGRAKRRSVAGVAHRATSWRDRVRRGNA